MQTPIAVPAFTFPVHVLIPEHNDSISLILEFEREMIAYLSSPKTETQDLNTYQIFRYKLETLKSKLMNLEQMANCLSNYLEREDHIDLKLRLIQGYCFYLHMNKTLKHVFKQEYSIQDWPILNVLICRAYSHFPERLNTNIKTTLYLSSTIIFMIEQLIKNPMILDNGREDQTFLAATIEVLINLAATAKANMLKAQCYLYLCILQTDASYTPIFADLKFEGLDTIDYYSKKLLSLVDNKPDAVDNKLMMFFANGSLFCNQLAQMANKIILKAEKKTNFHDLMPFSKSIFSISCENPHTVLKFLKDVTKKSTFHEGLKFVTELKDSNNGSNYYSLFQTNELINYLLRIYNFSLDIAATITSIFVDKSIDEGQLHYDLLLLQKEFLEAMINVNKLINNAYDEVLLQKLDTTVCQIKQYQNTERSRDDNSKLLTDFISEHKEHAVTTKKLKKEKRKPEYKPQQNNVLREENVTPAMIKPIEKKSQDQLDWLCYQVMNNKNLDDTELQREVTKTMQRLSIPNRPYSLPTIVKKKLELPPVFEKFVDLLTNNNYQVFIVGSFVRDPQNAYDIDVVVDHSSYNTEKKLLLDNLLPLLQSTFSNASIRGKHYPLICFNEGDVKIEVSALSAHPCKSHANNQDALFERLYIDACSRDTTNNAIFYDVTKNTIIDFFGGLEHIKNNELHCIEPPEKSFKDPARIFRIIRSLAQMTNCNATLFCPYQILFAIEQNIEGIKSLTKIRCFYEIKKLLFRGHARVIWQFLDDKNLLDRFFVLPTTSSAINLKHAFMVSRMLVRLDNRINRNTYYNKAFVFAVLLWGIFLEGMEKFTNKQQVETETVQLVNNILTDNRLIFSLPPFMQDEVKGIWLTYLTITNMIKQEAEIDPKYFQLAKAFEKLVSSSVIHTPREKIKNKFSGKSRFFRCQQYELVAREIIEENSLELTKIARGFAISLKQEGGNILSGKDKNLLLKKLKHHLQIVVGKYPLQYHITENSLVIETKSQLKIQSLDKLMSFLFQGKTDSCLSVKHP